MATGRLEELSTPELIAIILRLERRLCELEAEAASLRRRNAELETEVARLRKNPSKPPSCDITEPPKPPMPSGQAHRHIGGQPNHPRHERPAFPPDQVDRPVADCDRLRIIGHRDRRLGLEDD
jgi:hypothetical protein